MSTYLGNPSLSAAVKERVISTFQQALALYRQGRLDEVIAGCGLILQMDPQFDPAKRLTEKARNPMLPIDVDTLVPATSADEAMREAREAMRGRDFHRVINITTEILTEDLTNDEARILGDEAREKMEAAPFVEQFQRKFEQSLANNDVTTARATLEKARSLDPDHPAIGQMSARLGAAPPAPPKPPTPPAQPQPQPSFVVDAPQPSAGRIAAQASEFGFSFEEDKGGASPFGSFSFDTASPAPPPAPAADSGFGSFSFETPASAQPAEPTSGLGFSFDSAAPAAPAAPPPAAPAAGGFSFDTPATGSGFSFEQPAGSSAPDFGSAPMGREFDLSAATVETSPEDRKKIEQYLADGDRAFSAAEYQRAIDLWSRIFLIDVTNDQASERIERAKAKRRELEQKADAMIAAAVAAYDSKDLETARQGFNSVLRMDPANAAAHDYLDRIARETPEAPAPAAPGFVPPPPSVPASNHDKLDLFDDEFEGSYQAPIPEPAAEPVVEKKKPAPKPVAEKKGLPIAAIAAVIALIVLGAGGWFAYSKFFGKPAYDPTVTKAIFGQATRLAQHGQYDAAIQMLQDIKADDPQHDRAVIMIAELQHKKSQASEMIDGRPASLYFNEQVSAAQAAIAAHDFDVAKKAFEQAMRARPLPPDLKVVYDNAAQQVAKLDMAKSLFRERRYQDALNNLDALLQQDPQNPNIRRMIVDAHFNLGATALQEERLPDAIREFDEVLKIDPNDELAKRSKDLAARYNGQVKDLLYKIYVKYLPMRQVA